MRSVPLLSALVLSATLSLGAAEAEKVEVTALPDAVKATVTKEAADATTAMKSTTKDGKVVYRVKTKDADGKAQIVTIGEDGAVISKKEPKPK